MNAPLPHVYEETASASGGAVKSLESIGGPGFSPEQMLRVRGLRGRLVLVGQSWLAGWAHLLLGGSVVLFQYKDEYVDGTGPQLCRGPASAFVICITSNRAFSRF